MGVGDTITKTADADGRHDQLVADIVQCGHGDCKALKIDSLNGGPTTPNRKVLILLAFVPYVLTGLLLRLDSNQQPSG
jgi:hypothetical protein